MRACGGEDTVGDRCGLTRGTDIVNAQNVCSSEDGRGGGRGGRVLKCFE
jgi:hypothetical protein